MARARSGEMPGSRCPETVDIVLSGQGGYDWTDNEGPGNMTAIRSFRIVPMVMDGYAEMLLRVYGDPGLQCARLPR